MCKYDYFILLKYEQPCTKYLSTFNNISRFFTGFMIVTAFLSMFISNTATVAMMIPIVDALCNAIFKNQTYDHQKRNLLLLSVAYAANIGGTGFITGK